MGFSTAIPPILLNHPQMQANQLMEASVHMDPQLRGHTQVLVSLSLTQTPLKAGIQMAVMKVASLN